MYFAPLWKDRQCNMRIPYFGTVRLIRKQKEETFYLALENFLLRSMEDHTFALVSVRIL